MLFLTVEASFQEVHKHPLSVVHKRKVNYIQDTKFVSQGKSHAEANGYTLITRATIYKFNKKSVCTIL
jgi:hypothetical protein